LAEFKITEELIEKFSSQQSRENGQSYNEFYQKLSSIFFQLAENYEVDNCQFIATKDKASDAGYGHFLNQIEQAMKLLGSRLNLVPDRDEIIVRFHQHLAYYL